jgi:Glycosyltransferase family 87
MSASISAWERHRRLFSGLLWDRHSLPDGDRSRLPFAMRILPVGVFVLFPLVLVLGDGIDAVTSGSLGIDFRHAFWPAGRAILEGHTPYPPVDATVLAHGTSFVYPPIVAIALAPVALLPAAVATGIALLATIAALAGALWILNVREWRCYGAAAASPAVLGCVQTAALSGLLALAIAVAWRYRATGPVALVLVAAAIAAKLFLWPLILWVVVIRGMRSAVTTALVASLAVLAPWGLGFPGFRQYPKLLTMLTDVEGDHAYTPRALALALGAHPRLAELIALLIGGFVLALAARAMRNPDADRRVLALSLLAALLLSPVVWSHYFVVLLPIVAIASPRMGWAWLAPLALWLGGGAIDAPNGLQIALGLAGVVIATLPGLVTSDDGGHTTRRRPSGRISRFLPGTSALPSLDRGKSS